MSALLKTILSLSCSGALLIIILFLFRPLFHKSFSKQWQYYIWLIVIARLLLPFTFEINLMETLFLRIDKYVVQNQAIQNQALKTEPILHFSVETASATPKEHGKNTKNDEALLNDSSKSEKNELAVGLKIILRPPILLSCWLMIAIILFVRKITIYSCFVKYIKAGCIEVADIDLLEQYGKLIEQYNVKTTVELYTNKLISSPLLIGLFRPCIVLPTAKLTSSEFHYTIIHELTHYKRCDMFYKWLLQVTVCVHWFNPLVYLMSREVERACELSCDEAVIKNLELPERLLYGDTLLNAIGRSGLYKNSIASVTLSESGKQLEERLNSIKQFHKKSKLVIFLTIVFTVAISLGTIAVGAYETISLPVSDTVSSAKPRTMGALTLIEQEYTMEELKELAISEIYIKTLSDNVSVVRGGDALKFEYYALYPDEYTLIEKKGSFTEQQDFAEQQDKTICLLRYTPSKSSDERSITVTVPDEFPFKSFKINTTSGNINLTDCNVNSLDTITQNGQIDIYGGVVSERLTVETRIGNVLISATSLPQSNKNSLYKTTFKTESGTIIFQPVDSADNYCLNIDYGEEAEVLINGEGYGKGSLLAIADEQPVKDSRSLNSIFGQNIAQIESVSGEPAIFVRKNTFTLNEEALINIYFSSPSGTLIVQEK